MKKNTKPNNLSSSIEEVENAVDKRAPRRVRRFFRELGPRLITGAADDDPSRISTYSVTGASQAVGKLWVLA